MMNLSKNIKTNQTKINILVKNLTDLCNNKIDNIFFLKLSIRTF
jgi:hypothetical protein